MLYIWQKSLANLHCEAILGCHARVNYTGKQMAQG